MPRPRRTPPAGHSADWPDAPCSDPAAEKVRRFALRLREAMADRSLRQTVAEVDLDHTIVSDYLAGRTWPDSRGIALLEVALDASLWPPHEGPKDAIHDNSPDEGVTNEARDVRYGTRHAP